MNHFMSVPKNWEKRLLASSWLPVCPPLYPRICLSVWNKSASAEWIFVRVSLASFTKTWRQNSILIKSNKRNGNFIWKHRSHPVSYSTQEAQWGCHGSEAMVIISVNFTDQISERASNVTVYIHKLPACQSHTWQRCQSKIIPDKTEVFGICYSGNCTQILNVKRHNYKFIDPTSIRI
jgi:hypothetical protein